MILDEISIMRRLVADEKERIVITPIIDAGEQFGPSSIDLRLGIHFKVIRRTEYAGLNPADPKEKIKNDIIRYCENIDVELPNALVLHPGEFALSSTLEYIKLPRDIAARLEGRSSWGRLGLQIHSTAGFVDPGFAGTLTFELNNVGRVPFYIYPGTRVAQISFYELKEESTYPYDIKKYHKYQGDIRPAFSECYEDPEFDKLRKMINKGHFCSNCGKKISAEDKFCKHCGKKLA